MLLERELAEFWDSEDPPRAFTTGAGVLGTFAEKLTFPTGIAVFFLELALELELEELLEGVLLLAGETVGLETSGGGATFFSLGVFGKEILGEGVFGRSVFGESVLVEGVLGRVAFGVLGDAVFGDVFSGVVSPDLLDLVPGGLSTLSDFFEGSFPPRDSSTAVLNKNGNKC